MTSKRQVSLNLHITLRAQSEYFPASWEPVGMQEEMYASALASKLVETWEKINQTALLTATVEVGMNRPPITIRQSLDTGIDTQA